MATLKKDTDKQAPPISRGDRRMYVLCLFAWEIQPHGPYTFGTHKYGIFQSVLDLQSSKWIQETSPDVKYTSIWKISCQSAISHFTSLEPYKFFAMESLHLHQNVQFRKNGAGCQFSQTDKRLLWNAMRRLEDSMVQYRKINAARPQSWWGDQPWRTMKKQK